MTRRTTPHVHQISVSNGGVPKRAVPEARVTAVGLEGDRQRTARIHGGPDRAVCLFSLDVIEALQAEGHHVGAGTAGENFTLAGVDWRLIQPGVRVRVGDAVELEITSYTEPCERNARWFREGRFERISQDQYPGSSRVYARVLAEGVVRTGDPVVVEAALERR